MTANAMASYAELQVTTNFSFLRGGSHPHELVRTAAALGHEAIGVADRNTLAGVVRAHTAAKDAGLRLVVGARLDLTDGPSLLCFPTDKPAYARLSGLLTLGRRRAPKGECWLSMADLAEMAAGQIAIALPPTDAPGEEVPAEVSDGKPAVAHLLAGADARTLAALAPDGRFAKALAAYREIFGERLFLAAHHLYRGDDAARLAALSQLSARCKAPLVATNDVLYHHPARRVLQDVLTCVRHGCTIAEAGWRLHANGERHLKAPAEMARLFAGHEAALARTGEIARACTFSLDELRYEYPAEVAEGGDPQALLERLTWEGAAERYPGGVSETVRAQLRHELDLISQLNYASYFLTVYDIVRFARDQDILCQGRGSAANSAVCYVLGITAVDPARADLLFERFISAARNEPPDIDVDFEHERREEVMQYVYRKYGRERAGLTATVVCYRTRGALRDVGKAMGLSADVTERLSKTVWGWGEAAMPEHRVREAGLDPTDPLLARTVLLACELQGFPRHLSQHVGGFVISRGPLSDLVPIENAAMEDRTVVQWDKDDLDALGILKVDVLALGMLSCVRRAFDLLAGQYDRPLTLATLPAEDPEVYDMLCQADSLGVFQVESRAQMSMLPRLRPRNFYDLVIQVAIVRPGPIQGDMVHPYLRRRNGEEPVEYPSEELRGVLQKTLGVPLFQEQAMNIAIVGAGFTPADADRLRRAMATFKKLGNIEEFNDKFVNGLKARGYDEDFAERCFRQIEGFGNYGFPESHAASFALLVYVSSWIKFHYPEVFACALLNSQPMGFYAPAQIVRDAKEHGVTVLGPDINRSSWDSTLERDPSNPPLAGRAALPRPFVLRLGLRRVKGIKEEEAKALVAAREEGGPFHTPAELWRRSGLPPPVLDRLAAGDAFRSMGLDRRAAAWAVRGLGERPLDLFAGLEEEAREPAVSLPALPLGDHVTQDYTSLSLSLKAHPVGLLRASMKRLGYANCASLALTRDRDRAAVAGLVLVRQRPGSAKGVVFITVEDETGIANLVLMPDVLEKYRRQVMTGRLLGAHGRVEKEGRVIHLRVRHLVDLSGHLLFLQQERLRYGLSPSGIVPSDGAAPNDGIVPSDGAAPGGRDDFAGFLANADEVRHPQPDGREGTWPKARSFH